MVTRGATQTGHGHTAVQNALPSRAAKPLPAVRKALCALRYTLKTKALPLASPGGRLNRGSRALRRIMVKNQHSASKLSFHCVLRWNLRVLRVGGVPAGPPAAPRQGGVPAFCHHTRREPACPAFSRSPSSGRPRLTLTQRYFSSFSSRARLNRRSSSRPQPPAATRAGRRGHYRSRPPPLRRSPPPGHVTEEEYGARHRVT